MSGAQPKAGNIAGVISVTAEINLKAVHTRHSQGWVDEVIDNLDTLVAQYAKQKRTKRLSLLHIKAMWLMFGNVLIREYLY